MGTWYLSLALSLFLILAGLSIHWSVVLAGLLLPFIPMISILWRRRHRRTGVVDSDSAASRPVRSADRRDGGTRTGDND